MLINLVVLAAAGAVVGAAFRALRLPAIVGMMLAGVLMGPQVLDFARPDSVEILAQCRSLALVIILIRAGLGIRRSTLKQIGRPAVLLGILPSVLEGTAVAWLAQAFLGVSWFAAFTMGFVVAAVSPAIVVPAMLDYTARGWGRTRAIPTLILTGVSLENVFAITMVGVLLSVGSSGGGTWNVMLAKIPLGIAAGAGAGAFLGVVFSKVVGGRRRLTWVKALVFLGAAWGFYLAADSYRIQALLPVASLLGVLVMAFVLLERSPEPSRELAQKFAKIWVPAEVLLFVYIGCQVKLELLNADLLGFGMLILAGGLLLRSFGVAGALSTTPLTFREKLFCIAAYIPKATVQAALGAMPLSMAVGGTLNLVSIEAGELILFVAVMSIVVTAPLGAAALEFSAPRLLAGCANPPD